MSSTREDLHRLIDDLPPETLDAAGQSLALVLAHIAKVGFGAREQMPGLLLLELLNAPVDDEPVTAEDLEALAEGWDDIRAGRVRPWSDVERELQAEARNG